MACRRNSFRPAWKFQKPDLEDKGFYNIPIQKQTFGRVEPLLFLNINHNVYLIIHQKFPDGSLRSVVSKEGSKAYYIYLQISQNLILNILNRLSYKNKGSRDTSLIMMLYEAGVTCES